MVLCFTGYGFIFFDTAEAAQSAIADMDGKELDGHPIVVEPAHSAKKADLPAAGKAPRRLDLRIVVRGLHSRVSWQDLKDWSREAGDVTFTNVFERDGDHMGIVEFKVCALRLAAAVF